MGAFFNLPRKLSDILSPKYGTLGALHKIREHDIVVRIVLRMEYISDGIYEGRE